MRPLLLAALLSSSALASEPEAFGLPLDKVLHASLSANLEAACMGISIKLGTDPKWAALGCTAGVLLIGGLKELVWDLALHKGTPDVADFIADTIGTGAGLIAVGLVLRW